MDPAGSRRGRTSEKGRGLLELLTAITILLILAAASIPRARGYVQESRLRGAALHLRGLFRQARARAASENRYVGVVFDEAENDPVFTIYGDGNGNGIRRAEVASGIEVKLGEPYHLSARFPGVRYGQPPQKAGEPSLPGLRIGRSHIVSFSPIGSSTSGTLFLTNEHGSVYAVVVFGSTGRVRVARFYRGKWQAI